MTETTNAQEWLDENYLEEKRSEIRLLAIDSRKLKGNLKLADFINLEILDCYQNELDGLEIINCSKITHLNVSCNSFKNLDFLKDLDTEKLVFLSVHTNNFTDSDLTPFSKFTNLEELYIDNYDKNLFTEDKYNRFYGSLKPLENLKNLRLLNISGTNVGSGLKYLADSVSKISCNDNSLGDKIGCLKIKKELEDAAKELGEELTSPDERDTKWTKDWYRLGPWREKKESSRERINAQDWLDKEYPKWIKNDKKDLWINNKDLWDNLDLSEFSSLEKLYCYDNKIKGLKIDNLKNLTEIHAWNNRLTELNIDNCPNIKILNVSNNRLTNLNFLRKVDNKSKIEFLDISNNNFHKKIEEENKKEPLGLDVFKEFTNLKELYIGSWGDKSNYFEGSLKSLEKLDKLEYLGIDNTDIDTGLSDLPENLEVIHCGVEIKSAKCRVIWEKLKKYSIPGRRYSYDFQALLANSEKDIKTTLERLFNRQNKSVTELKKLEEIAKKIKNQKQGENSSKWLGYVGGGASTVGSLISGSLLGTDNFPEGSSLTIINPIISGAGGVISMISTNWSSRLTNEKKISEEEFNNNLTKLGVDIWNKLLRDREELEEKKDQIKEFILEEKHQESFEVFLKASSDLPKSLSPEEKQRMKKEIQEEFIINLWKNHWEKNDYELRKKLERFLDEIAEKMVINSEISTLESKLNILSKDLENLKNDESKFNNHQQKKALDNIINKIGKLKTDLESEKKENLREKIHHLTTETKKYFNSWLSLEAAYRENRELKREIQKLQKKSSGESSQEQQIVSTNNEQKEEELVKIEENLVDSKNIIFQEEEIDENKIINSLAIKVIEDTQKIKDEEKNLEIQGARRRKSYQSIDIDINTSDYKAQIQTPDK